MLTAQRRKEIFHILELAGQVELNELANRFDVSVMTIRRDLEFLESKGRVRRVHGGAILTQWKWTTDTIEVKSTTNIELKQTIARNALQIIHANSSIFLDAGSTTLEIAKLLSSEFIHSLNICTPDLQIASILSKVKQFEVYSCGGLVNRSTESVGGPFCIHMIKSLYADLAFIGCDGITLKDGAMATQISQVDVKQAMIDRSLQCALVADYTKFGRISFATISALSTFDFMVSDGNLEPGIRLNVEKFGVKIIG
ncbi:MAG: DeoR/GlpR family DNA-binding transcription regulator [Acidibacillus sp.]|nr:DeoR/GlpR family DNA-binding transcription regulator [Acidibacillus sp.]